MTTKALQLLSEAATQLNVKSYQIVYAITTGRVPDVQRIGGRRVFTPADVAQLKEYFEGKKQRRKEETQ